MNMVITFITIIAAVICFHSGYLIKVKRRVNLINGYNMLNAEEKLQWNEEKLIKSAANNNFLLGIILAAGVGFMLTQFTLYIALITWGLVALVSIFNFFYQTRSKRFRND